MPRRDWSPEVLAILREGYARSAMTIEDAMYSIGHRDWSPRGLRGGVDAALQKLRRQGQARYDRGRRVWVATEGGGE